eukprot:CAMPEP_0172377000 /NCGR_PEP_ID=MMETSP1060-20121228/68676_1 /TAXON_ID=37318 /ORGANISM="Pseudo-nitzschia pungens, Strain cf. cingulata" /LENGTH=800 /DNA_ID=CAMNT_0013104667 /DNA_START=97 /DNA_END=2499 /DNA_ORIENTATION=+
MSCKTVTSSSAFDSCPDRSYSSRSTLSRSTLIKPIYYRIDWDGVELPRQPSLKLEDDRYFFQLIGSYHPNDTGTRRRRYFDFVRRFSSLSKWEKKRLHLELGDEVSTQKYKPVPLRVRKKEIQLVQRKLPRFPSKRHLSEASFYPLASSEPLQIFRVDVDSNSTNVKDIDEDLVEDDDEAEVEIISIDGDQAFFNNHYEEEDETVEESCDETNQAFFDDYYEDDMEEELFYEIEEDLLEEEEEEEEILEEVEEELYDSDQDYINEQQLDELQVIHSKNIDYIDQKERQRRLEVEQQHLHALEASKNTDDGILGDIDDNIDDNIIDDETESSAASQNNESLSSSTSSSPEEIRQEDPIHEPQIGVVPPSIQSMVIQAKFELRCRKVPEEHKRKLKHPLAQALEIGLFTRLEENIVEAFGKRPEKYKATELPSATWKKGNETVVLPNLQNANPAQFTIFEEAVALGGIKALKPKITTNFDNLASTKSYLEEEVDVDDSSKPKFMRTKYLTDLYLDSEHRGKSDDDYRDIECVHCDSLDDVKLPTDQCPVRTRVTTKMTHLELNESLSRKVAEKVWERRYRLERPRAQQHITDRCKCIYCKTSSPYQTVAYRKKWLVQQNLWKEPPPKKEPIIAVSLQSVRENNGDDASVDTNNSSDTLHSDTFSVFATEDVELTNIAIGSANFETENDGAESRQSSQGESDLPRATAKPRKTFMAEVQSLLRINKRPVSFSTRRSEKKIARKERLEKARKERLEKARRKRREKARKKRSKHNAKESSSRRGFLKNRIRSMNFLFGSRCSMER